MNNIENVIKILTFTDIGGSLLPNAINLTIDESIIMIDITIKIIANALFLVIFRLRRTILYQTTRS